MTATSEPIKFAYWVPNVSGGLVISSVEQRTSWTPEYNRKLAQIAEKAGFDYALSQIRFTAGYGADNQHESLSFSQDLLAHTETLKVIAAVLPGPWNPALLSKQIATITHLVGPRVAVNIVSGWFRGEFHAIGEPWLDHDERYRRSEEFINAIRGIWSEPSFTFKGDFYRFNAYSQKPKPLGALPEIFQGGSSRGRATWRPASRTGISPTATRPRGSRPRSTTSAPRKSPSSYTRPRAKIGINAFASSGPRKPSEGGTAAGDRQRDPRGGEGLPPRGPERGRGQPRA